MMRLRLGRGRVTEPVSAPHLTTERVWNELEKASFAVISYVTLPGEGSATPGQDARPDRSPARQPAPQHHH